MTVVKSMEDQIMEHRRNVLTEAERKRLRYRRPWDPEPQPNGVHSRFLALLLVFLVFIVLPAMAAHWLLMQ